jgi:crotonobetainyl-CoA:carnitine CoA-transferase CaiB-like acyl-CoA transferase
MSGLRALEIASEWTAPCGRLLAEAGIEVILVEPVGGSAHRYDEAPDGSRHLSAASLFHDTGKRSVTLDLRSGPGRSAFESLVATADLVIEGEPPGGLAAQGLGYERLAGLRPGLVLTSITPFGQDGPCSALPADDLVTFAMGGVMFISGEPSAAPVCAPDGQSYVLAGAHAAFAALAALWRREQGGPGEWIDVSAFECWAAQENTISNYLGPGDYARRAGSQHRTSLPGRIFRCRDGFLHLFISREVPVWERFLRWIGNPPELADPALGEINERWRHLELVDRVTQRFLDRHDRDELFESAQALHLPCVPVNGLAEFLVDPQTTASRPVLELPHPEGGTYATLRSPLPFGYEREPRRAPRSGEDDGALPARSAPTATAAVPAERPPALPLGDVRVCAFTHVAAGPYATLQLAYLGADVLKVESRTRIDYWRYRDRNNDPERSRPFADHNKNVRSVTLNLRTPEGLELARELALASDVVIDNFSAGVMDRLGLGYDALAARRPDTIVVHMTGLGSVGPRAHYVTFGPSLMAFCGLTELWNLPGQEHPVGSQSSYPDYLAGVYAAYAIVAALHHRRATGRGALLDLSQVLIAAAAIGPSMVRVLSGLGEPEPIGNASAVYAPHGCYPCRGGTDDWCVISVTDERHWQGLRRALGSPAWAAGPWCESMQGRLARRAELDERIGAWTRSLSAHGVVAECRAHGVPAGVVATGEDLINDPHLRARAFFAQGEHERLGSLCLPGSPVRMRDAQIGVRRFGPLLGEDTDAILAEVLGLDGPERERYAAADALR